MAVSQMMGYWNMPCNDVMNLHRINRALLSNPELWCGKDASRQGALPSGGDCLALALFTQNRVDGLLEGHHRHSSPQPNPRAKCSDSNSVTRC